MNSYVYLLIFVFSKKTHINLNTPLKTAEQSDTQEIHETIDEDRRLAIQVSDYYIDCFFKLKISFRQPLFAWWKLIKHSSTLCWWMKSFNNWNYISYLEFQWSRSIFFSFWKTKDNEKFSPLQKCIDILIEKEYLTRQPNETDVLCYVT